MISRHTHLKIAAALWGLVGLGLSIAGLFFLFGPFFFFGSRPPNISFISFFIAEGLGWIKWKFVITRVSKKNIARIHTLPEQSPFYITFSARSWFLIFVMILLGRLIRFAGAPSFIVGGIYVAVGTALFLGSGAYLKDKATER